MIKKEHITFLAANMLDCFLAKCGPNFKRDVVGYLSLDQSKCHESVEIVAPDFVNFENADLPIFERIIKSYRLAKKDQLKADPVYLPSSLWQGQLDLAYASLYEEKIEKPAFFLSNFGAWPEYTGIENTIFIKNMLSSQAGRTRLKRVFLRLINYWMQHEQKGRGFDALSYPSFGNQYGFRFRDHFIGLGSVFSDVHTSVLADIIGHNRPPPLSLLRLAADTLGSFISCRAKLVASRI